MERLINFDPQWINDVVITGINIFILFFAMSYLLFNPARDYLEKRRKKIAGDLEMAKSSRESALALQAEYEEKLRSINKEAEAIMDEARKKAKKQEAEILEEARAEAGRILERASREIDLEKKKALEDVKTEIVSIASLMAGKAVAASMDVKLQDSLIQETLKEMGESTWQSECQRFTETRCLKRPWKRTFCPSGTKRSVLSGPFSWTIRIWRSF